MDSIADLILGLWVNRKGLPFNAFFISFGINIEVDKTSFTDSSSKEELSVTFK